MFFSQVDCHIIGWGRGREIADYTNLVLTEILANLDSFWGDSEVLLSPLVLSTNPKQSG